MVNTSSFQRRDEILAESITPALYRATNAQIENGIPSYVTELNAEGKKCAAIIGEAVLQVLVLHFTSGFAERIRALLDRSVKKPEDRKAIGLPDE